MPKKLPEHWRHTFCAFIADGKTLADAADATGVAAGTVRRHMSEDPDFRELYDEAREAVRDKVRNRVWTMGMGGETDPPTMRWALDHLIKWNLPEAKEAQRLELTGSEGGPLEVTVTHDYDRILTKLEQAGLIRPGPAALTGPEAQPVLPARTD